MDTLDNILEEEYRNEYGKEFPRIEELSARNRGMLRRVAARAYRVGVEDVAESVNGFHRIRVQPDAFRPKAVRPAPQPSSIWPVEWHEKFCLIAQGGIVRDCICLRRKGQRRKGLEVCPHAPDLPGRCFVFQRNDGSIYHAGDSRRQDRRKS